MQVGRITMQQGEDDAESGELEAAAAGVAFGKQEMCTVAGNIFIAALPAQSQSLTLRSMLVRSNDANFEEIRRHQECLPSRFALQTSKRRYQNYKSYIKSGSKQTAVTTKCCAAMLEVW